MQNEILAGWAHAAREMDALHACRHRGLADTAPRLRCRWTLNNPCRSCRRLCNADRNALSRQIAVVQHFVFDLVDMHRHTQRLVGALDRRQREAGMPRAENDRRHHHVQSIEATGGKKSRDRRRRRLRSGPGEVRARPKRQGSPRERSARHSPARQSISTPGGGAQRVPCATISRRRAPSAANTLASRPSRPLGSMTTRAGCGSRHAPHGELRIVGDGGADAYNDTVDQRPQPMQVGKAGRAVDVFRVPGFGRNAAIERLADLADHDEIVHRALAQRAKYIAPGLWQGSAKTAGKAGPRSGKYC